MIKPNTLDDEYLMILLNPIMVCARYRPKLGHGGKDGYSFEDFRKIYSADPFYSWMGLDSPLMYSAHKAAGGMTSIYRQIGIGCEALFRRILQDQLRLSVNDVRWSYTVPKADAGTRKLSLDGRIPLPKVEDKDARNRIRSWMDKAADFLGVKKEVANQLDGIVFEIRQGYKSKDSKRQNADIANAATAYTNGYLPTAGILSLQIDSDIAIRYKAEKWVLLTGTVGKNNPQESFYDFVKQIIGFDLQAFFERNSKTLKKNIVQILRELLSPDTQS